MRKWLLRFLQKLGIHGKNAVYYIGGADLPRV